MSEKQIKRYKRKFNQYKDDLLLQFLNSLKDVGLILRLKVCWKILHTNFNLFDKRGK
jgi:hypothetical protein